MNLTQEIEAIITKAESMKTAVGVNKKYLNKCIDRLVDASLYSEKIVLPGSLADRPEASTCICPQGAVDNTCPTHGGWA